MDNHLNIQKIKELCEKHKLRWTNHVFVRMLQRNITISDIEYAIMNGEIIELYPNDYPYPSCLILGINIDNKHIHIVCGLSDIELYLITAYYPNPDEWSDDFKIRKEMK